MQKTSSDIGKPAIVGGKSKEKCFFLLHFARLFVPLQSQKTRIMKKYILFVVVACLMMACSNKHEEQKKELRHDLRTQFYAKELKKVEAEMVATDSLLRIAEADDDTLNVEKRIRLDSLKLEADVQSAKIRYIHKKQEELKELE